METLFDGIPLDEVSTSMTINCPAAIAARLLRRATPRSRACRARSCAARSRRTSSRSTSRRRGGSSRPAVPAAHDGHDRVLHAAGAAVEPDLDLRLPHPRGRLDRRSRSWRSRSPNGFTYVEEAMSAASTSTTSRRGSRSSGTPPRLLRGDRQAARGAPHLGAHMRERYGAKTRARGSCASTPRPPACRCGTSSPRSTSSAPRSRRWRRCWAAPSRSTRTRWTRRSRCRPRRRSRSRCAPSR